MNRLMHKLSALLLAFVLAVPNPALAFREPSVREKDPKVLAGLEQTLRSDHPDDLVQLASASIGLPSSFRAPISSLAPAAPAAGLEEKHWIKGFARGSTLFAAGMVAGAGLRTFAPDPPSAQPPAQVVSVEEPIPAPQAAVIQSKSATVRVDQVDASFWKTGYGAGLRLTGDQRAQVEQFVAGQASKVEVTAVSGGMLFHLYADPALAAIADRKVKEQPVEGIHFDVSILQRDKPLTFEAFTVSGLIAADSMLSPPHWVLGSKSPVREVTVSNTDFSEISPVAWVALAYNRKLSLEQLVSHQGILTMTARDAQGNTVHLLFA